MGEPHGTGLPSGVSPYRRTADFDARSVPRGLLKAHATKPHVWAVLHVLEGTVSFRFLEPAPSQRRLGAGEQQVIPPAVRHEVRPDENARFYVEFHRASDATAG